MQRCDAPQQLLPTPAVRCFLECLSAVPALAKCTRYSRGPVARGSHHPVHGSKCHANDRRGLRSTVFVFSEQSCCDTLCAIGAGNAAENLSMDRQPVRENDRWPLLTGFAIINTRAGLSAETRRRSADILGKWCRSTSSRRDLRRSRYTAWRLLLGAMPDGTDKLRRTGEPSCSWRWALCG